jgi:SAM-dependent methyltransferase
VLVSAAIHLFVTPERMQRLLPRRPLGGATLGLVFPVCAAIIASAVTVIAQPLNPKNGAPMSKTIRSGHESGTVTTMRARPDYGVDAPGVIRWNALGAAAELAAGTGLTVAGLEPGPWLLVLGTIWLLTPVAMLASSKVGKLRQRDAILDQVALHGDEHVLDVGTGHGLMAIGAAKRLRTGRAVGVDIWRQRDQADNTRDSALRNVESEGVTNRCTVQDGDVRALPFPDDSFDVVLAFFALHNVPGAEGKGQACREIARVLKPGGRVFDYDMVFTTAPFVRGFAEAGLDLQVSGLIWRTYPPGRLITGRSLVN